MGGKPCTDPEERGKHPQGNWGGVTLDESRERLAEWFGDREDHRANVAVAAGPSHLVIIDEDEVGALAAYAARVGAELPSTFRVQASRGLHWYFREPVDAHGVRIPLGNAAGALDAFHMDVRGGAGPSGGVGGYVIGPGSQHWTNKIYTPVASDAVATVMPGWLVEAIQMGPPDPAEGTVPGRAGQPGNAGTTGGTRWDDRPRYGSRAELVAQFARHCAEVTEPGQPFRRALFLAALDGWRLVDLGEIEEDAMLAEIERCVERVWADPRVRAAARLTGPYTGPDDHDHEHVFRDARPAAERSRWVVTEETHAPRTFGDAPVLTSVNGTAERTTAGNRAVDDDHAESAPDEVESIADRELTPEEVADPALAEEVARQLRRTRGQQIIAARRGPMVPMDLRAALLDPRPEYLVPGMIPRNGLAAIFGAPGCGKSFFALDIALSLVTGTPWGVGEGVLLTRPDGTRGTVHYVMAEAAGPNTSRTAAWLTYHGKGVDDILPRYVPFAEAFTLTEAGVRCYLPRVVEDKPNLIILDTLNAMSEGKESAGEDMGAIIRVLHKIRMAAGGCAVVVIAHTGLGSNAQDRMRGSNALEAGMDTTIKVTEKDGLHLVTMPRNRSAQKGAVEWPFRLASVDMGGWDEAVPVPDSGDHRPFVVDPGWGDPAVPTPINDLITNSREPIRGGATVARPGKREARVIVLLVRALTDEASSQERLLKLINKERPNKKDHMQPFELSRGCALLVAEGIVHQVGTDKIPRYVIAPEYSRTEMPE